MKHLRWSCLCRTLNTHEDLLKFTGKRRCWSLFSRSQTSSSFSFIKKEFLAQWFSCKIFQISVFCTTTSCNCLMLRNVKYTSYVMPNIIYSLLVQSLITILQKIVCFLTHFSPMSHFYTP